MHPMLNVAVRAARKASAIINRGSLELDRLTVQRKRQNDFVSEIDRNAEEAIIDTIRKAYPSHAILAEESGADGESEYTWLIDPLDGTTNFLHGFPQYCVSIGLMHHNAITQAVVYDPNRNELFTASKGGGAFLNERRIRVSKRIRLDESLIGTGFPYRGVEDFDAYMAVFAAVTRKASGIRRAGAAALDLAYVACGRLDGFWEVGLSAWDMAAGALLIREAGGIASDIVEGDDFLESGRIIAGNPKVFAQLLPELVPHARGTTRKAAGT